MNTLTMKSYNNFVSLRFLYSRSLYSPFLPLDPQSQGKGCVFRRLQTFWASRRGIWTARRPLLDLPAPSSQWSLSHSAVSGEHPVCSMCNLQERVREDRVKEQLVNVWVGCETSQWVSLNVTNDMTLKHTECWQQTRNVSLKATVCLQHNNLLFI